MPINNNQLWEDAEQFDAPVRTAFAVTSAMGWTFFEELVRTLQEGGFDPVLTSSPGYRLQHIAKKAGVQSAPIPMKREISPLSDIRALWRLYRFMRRARPAITNVGTPKAGLLGGLAAWLAGVPCRIYTLHGLRLETTAGCKRTLLSWAERLACRCAHRVICVSPSVRDRAIEMKLVPAEKTAIMASGSFCGVDVERFSPHAVRAGRERLRERLGIPSGAPVVGFVGRLTRDKGIPELLAAFDRLRERTPELRLLLVGGFEYGDPVPAHVRWRIETDPHILCTGFIPDPAPYYGLMDAFVLPSYREGFPIVSIEAQACGIPVITTTATGAVDSIADGVTGFLVPAGDLETLVERIDLLLRNPLLRARMGRAGRALVMEKFRQEIAGQALLEEYRRMLRSKGLKAPCERVVAVAGD